MAWKIVIEDLQAIEMVLDFLNIMFVGRRSVEYEDGAISARVDICSARYLLQRVDICSCILVLKRVCRGKAIFALPSVNSELTHA